MIEDEIVKKIKLTNGIKQFEIASFVIPHNENKWDTKHLMQTEAQRIFNQYSHIVKDEKKLQAFSQITQQTNSFIKRLEEHRQILKAQIELQLKICQGNIQLQKALQSYNHEFKK